MIDPESKATEDPGPQGDRPSFPGPTRVLNSAQESQERVFYRGSCNCQGYSIKPWRFELTSTAGNEKVPWLCLVLPFESTGKRPQKNGPGSAAQQLSPIEFLASDYNLPDNVRKKCQELVDEIIFARDSQGTEGACAAAGGGGGGDGGLPHDQLRAQLIERLEKVIRECLSPGRKRGRWADHVFSPSYARFTLEQVRQWVSRCGHLPWMRSEEEVAATGLDMAADFVDLLETVENAFLAIFDLRASLSELQAGTAAEREREGQLGSASEEFVRYLLIYAKAVPRAR